MLNIRIITNVISIWYLKTFVYIYYFFLVVIFTNDFKQENYVFILAWVTAQFILVGYQFKLKDDTVNKYLEKLQQKLNIDQNWKRTIDNLSEGIIIIDRAFKILYKNSTINKIFGLQNNNLEKL
jgi:c-di-AMP phosphodiesterase-like protein